MSSAATVTTSLPQGTWQSDPIHSSASFAVRHLAVGKFRGQFEHLDAALTVGEDGAVQLNGTVQADSIVVKDEGLQGHLGSPDFFDFERYPQIGFKSVDVRLDGDQVVIDGDLTIKDRTGRVEARGTLTGPAETPAGTKIGLSIETVIDRSEFGLEWNAPLPKGGFAVGNEVTLTVDLELALNKD
jgi:polyisoprenoid-binding protein YceI